MRKRKSLPVEELRLLYVEQKVQMKILDDDAYRIYRSKVMPKSTRLKVLSQVVLCVLLGTVVPIIIAANVNGSPERMVYFLLSIFLAIYLYKVFRENMGAGLAREALYDAELFNFLVKSEFATVCSWDGETKYDLQNII